MILYIIWNLIVLLIYGYDKLMAKLGKRRVPEKVLLTIAFLMGGAGAGLGMLLFRHKTRKAKFTILVPLALIVNLLIIFVILRYVGEVDIFAPIFGDKVLTA